MRKVGGLRCHNWWFESDDVRLSRTRKMRVVELIEENSLIDVSGEKK